MKKFFLTLLIAVSIALTIDAAKLPPLEFTPGKDLTLINKLMDTPRRYARVDTVKYTGFNDYQRKELVQQTAGLALVFETNSPYIYANIYYLKRKTTSWNGPQMSVAGVDLYIKNKKGEWEYAGNNVPHAKNSETFQLVSNLPKGKKECMIYLPTYSELNEINVGVKPGCYVRPIENPFRHRVVFHGSSYTHGSSTSHPAMAYPMQFERATGLHTPSLGASGNSKLEQAWANVLADTPADAFVIDAFSNPLADEIEERFDSYLATIRAKHPNTPIIFQQTIYRENRNFDSEYDKREQAKMDAAEKMVRKAMKTDKNVYIVYPKVEKGATCDGIHPSDYGYYQWMMSIKQPVLDILEKYNIK